MAWQEVETDVGSKAGATKYSVAMKHGGARVSIPAGVREKLGWTEKTTLKLMVGGGEMTGKLRLEPSPAGKILGRKPPMGGGGLIIRLGRWPSLVNRDVDAVAVDAEFDGSALVVALPVHAQAIQPAPRPAIATAATSPPGAKVSVNDKFFNDPRQPVAMTSGVRGQR